MEKGMFIGATAWGGRPWCGEDGEVRVADAKGALDQPTVRAFDHIDDAALWALNIGRAYPQTLAERIGST